MSENLSPPEAQTSKTLQRVTRTKSLDEAVAVLAQARELDISRDPWSSGGPPMSLGFVTAMPFLKKLVANDQKFDSLEPLFSVSLTTLSLKNVGPVDLAQFGGLVDCEHLNLSGCSLSSVERVADYKGLRTLSLAKCGLKSYDFVGGLTSLEVLDLSENDLTKLPDLSRVLSLKNLKVTKNMLEQLTPLRTLRGLRDLDFSDNAIVELDDLENLRHLTTLRFAKNRVRSLKPLRSLDLLETVALSLNPVHEDEIDEVLRRRVRLVD